MKLKEKFIALTAALMLSYPSFVNPSGGLNYTGNKYEMNYKGKKYDAVRCTSLENKVDGWCIENDQQRFVTERNDYYNLALMFEVERDSKILESTITDTKEVFDTAFNVQLIIDTSKFVMDKGAEVESVLIRGLFSGGISVPQEIQRKIIKNTFKAQQKEVYSMVQDNLENILGGVKGLFEDFQHGKISEEEINKVKEKLELDIKNMFGQCYEYQLKLASAELGKAEKLIQKKNKTKYEYQLLQDYIVDGMSRGFMATTYLNVINESRTLDKSINRILYKMGEGADLDAILDLSAFAENPDLEKASREAEKEFNEFRSRFSSNSTYWDLTDPDSHASRILPLIIEAQKRRDKKKNEGKVSYIDLDCDRKKEKISIKESKKNERKSYVLFINDAYISDFCSVKLRKNEYSCGYDIEATKPSKDKRFDCIIKQYYKWDGKNLIRRLKDIIYLNIYCTDNNGEGIGMGGCGYLTDGYYEVKSIENETKKVINEFYDNCRGQGYGYKYAINNLDLDSNLETVISNGVNSSSQELIRDLDNLNGEVVQEKKEELKKQPNKELSELKPVKTEDQPKPAVTKQKEYPIYEFLEVFDENYNLDGGVDYMFHLDLDRDGRKEQILSKIINGSGEGIYELCINRSEKNNPEDCDYSTKYYGKGTFTMKRSGVVFHIKKEGTDRTGNYCFNGAQLDSCD